MGRRKLLRPDNPPPFKMPTTSLNHNHNQAKDLTSKLT